MATRRLSDSEESSNADNTLSQLIEECATLEGDLGEIFPQDSTSQLDLDAAEQVARIAFSLYQDALAFESEMKQTQPEIQSAFPVLPPSSGVWLAEADYASPYLVGEESTPQQHDAARDNQRLSSGPTTSEHQPTDHLREILASSAQPPGKASQPAYLGLPFAFHDPSHSSLLQHSALLNPCSGGVAHRSDAGPQPTTAAEYSVGLLPQAAGGAHDAGMFPQGAPLLPQDAGRRSSGLKRRIEPSKGVHPELDPDSWLDAIEEIGSAPEGHGGSQIPSPPRRSSNLPARGSRTARKVPARGAKQRAAGRSPLTASGGGAEGASAAAASPAAGSLQASWIREHPYARLPALKEGVHAPLILLSASSFALSSTTSVNEALLSFRRVFINPVLDQKDANLLGACIRELAIASAPRAKANKRMVRPLHGVVILGRQFLVLDAIVSALHVFRISPASCTWWEAFIDCFNTSYRYGDPTQHMRNSGRVSTDLANRMLAAISIYKQGKRPDPEEIIHIKRILFFSPYAPVRFRESTFDPWRTDHLLFEQDHPGFSEWLRKRRHVQH
ncbi:hypothetical protein EPH_0006420 [Eimeria praecox]|uniref:Uncharacterized protein n=1 Tax=Eimeria praecox TaxID=51316 RepID=U6G6P5_9EIME|nr:hypothetical protein EPH_0006420 [Eimeria praecox]